jgi:acyl-CoA thioesterase
MPVADLVGALELEEVGANSYRAKNYELGERGVVFGGQLIAQLIVAGSKADPTKSVKSAHALFARPVLVADDVELRVDVLQAGRTFASATASIWQADKERARAMVLLSADEPDLIRHAATMPDVAGPEDLDPAMGSDDTRIVDNIDILDADSVGDPTIGVWIRRPSATDDPAVGQGLLAHASASFLIAASMRPHPGVGQSAAHAAFSTGIIGHTISFHEPVDLDHWHLLSQQSTYTGRGRAFGRGEVFDRAGQLVASYSQESMVRHFPEGLSPEGQESTIL